MIRARTACIAVLMVVAAAVQADADITAFIGANTTPANRALRGLSIGAGFLAVAFEFEYATTPDAARVDAPSLKTGSGNILLQSPFMIHGFQPYFTTGAGLYRERLGSSSETGFATNAGGGVKVGLAGPVRLRVDYRVLRLGRGALYSPAHRVYAGLNLTF